jgi:lycopene cyclase domain-containing protein
MTYATLALLFLAGSSAVAVGAARATRLPRGWWTATVCVGLALLVLTVAFDSLMVGADLFRYGDGALVGARVLLVPVEDLAWPLAAVLLVPALWELAGLPAGAFRQLVGSSRPLSWVNTAYPFGAAYLVGGGSVDLTLAVGVLFFLVPYNLLMYGVNDVFDYESDLRNPRKGGVEGVVLADRWHRLTLWTAASCTAPFVIALVMLGSARSSAVLVAVVLAVVGYSAPVLRLKERPFLDSLTSSTHFVGPAVFGYALVEPAPTTSAAVIFLAFFLWGMASHAFGAVQDIRADKGAGIASVATWLGAGATVRLSLAAYVVAGALLLLGTTGPGRLAALLVLPYIANVLPFVSVTEGACESANAGWRRFLTLNYVTGFLVTQLLIWTTLAG